MIPPIAAIEPRDREHDDRGSLWMLMPARRAASTLPPTAKTWRPKRVRLRDVLHAGHEADEDQHRERHAAVGVEDRDRRDHGRRDDHDPDDRPGELACR